MLSKILQLTFFLFFFFFVLVVAILSHFSKGGVIIANGRARILKQPDDENSHLVIFLQHTSCAVWATTKQACRDEPVVYLLFSSIYTSLYYIFLPKKLILNAKLDSVLFVRRISCAKQSVKFLKLRNTVA